jgi:hypothetical protein
MTCQSHPNVMYNTLKSIFSLNSFSFLFRRLPMSYGLCRPQCTRGSWNLLRSRGI